MSAKTARSPVHTNGHAPPEPRQRPSFVSSAGYRLHYRHLSPDTLPRLQAAARLALANDKPPIPTQRVEVGPEEWRDEPNPHDEAYQQALEAWEARVVEQQGLKFLKLCEDYALIYEVDEEEVAALRAVHTAIGDPLDDMSNAQVYLWRIALPGPDDQGELYGRLFGRNEEAIQAQKAAFRSYLQGAIAQAFT
jgi:hypothetical protein